MHFSLTKLPTSPTKDWAIPIVGVLKKPVDHQGNEWTKERVVAHLVNLYDQMPPIYHRTLDYLMILEKVAACKQILLFVQGDVSSDMLDWALLVQNKVEELLPKIEAESQLFTHRLFKDLSWVPAARCPNKVMVEHLCDNVKGHEVSKSSEIQVLYKKQKASPLWGVLEDYDNAPETIRCLKNVFATFPGVAGDKYYLAMMKAANQTGTMLAIEVPPPKWHLCSGGSKTTLMHK